MYFKNKLINKQSEKPKWETSFSDFGFLHLINPFMKKDDYDKIIQTSKVYEKNIK